MATGQVNTGGVSSSMIKSAEVVLLFPQASVAVNVTVTAPFTPQVPVRSAVKSFVHVTSAPQLSLRKVAPPLLLSQANRAVL